MHSLGIVQWDSTRRDHLRNPGRVSGSGPVIYPTNRGSAWPPIECLIDKSGIGMASHIRPHRVPSVYSPDNCCYR